MHAVGLLGRGTRGWLVDPDRPASPGGRRGLVCPADVDRARSGQRDHDEGPQETVPHLPATDVHQRGPESPGGNRLVSVFCQGIAVILALLIKGQLALPEKWYPEPWPGIETIVQE